MSGSPHLHILVYGTGAVGGYLGVRLALADQRVTFLARPQLKTRLGEHGLTLEGYGHIDRPDVITDVVEWRHPAPPGAILLAVKAYDVDQAAGSIAARWSDAPPVVCLQNGIGNEARLALKLGEHAVISATLTTAVQMVDPGRLRVSRERGLGLAVDRPIVGQIAQTFAGAGILTRLYPDRDRMKWSKVLTNIVVNATSAILGWTPAQIFAHPGLARLEIEALREVTRVMRPQGMRPHNLPGVPVGWLGLGLKLPSWILTPLLRAVVVSGRGDKWPSFYYDVGRGKSEVAWLNGAIVRAGEEFQVPTPANHVLNEILTQLVTQAIPPQEFRDRPERLLGRARRAGVPGLDPPAGT